MWILVPFFFICFLVTHQNFGLMWSFQTLLSFNRFGCKLKITAGLATFPWKFKESCRFQWVILFVFLCVFPGVFLCVFLCLILFVIQYVCVIRMFMPVFMYIFICIFRVFLCVCKCCKLWSTCSKPIKTLD